MELIYQDRDIIVCVKPAGVLSTDEPGGLPELVRQALGDPNANVRTVHRLDRVVSGLMVLARSKKAAAALSQQIREDRFEKEYMAVVHGMTAPEGTFRDLLLRNKEERDAYRNDHACTNPKVAGDQLLPVTSFGEPDIPDEVFDRVRELWENGEQAK